MKRKNAEWELLTQWLVERDEKVLTITWTTLGEIVGGLPNSASDHFPQWWHGDRPNTRAWRAAGYELAEVHRGQTLTLVKSQTRAKSLQSSVATAYAVAPSRSNKSQFQHPDQAGLATINPLSALIVLPCSKHKILGGANKSVTATPTWSPELLLERKHLQDRVQLDDHLVTPAWQRYQGGFYKAAGFSLSRAVSGGANIAILSGGYGVVRASEEIGWYDRALKKSDWRRGLLEETLISEALRVDAKEVVAFAARTSEYAKIIKHTPWRQAGIRRAVLVTSTRIGGGAMRKVPADLGFAFRAFWYQHSEEYPADISCEELT